MVIAKQLVNLEVPGQNDCILIDDIYIYVISGRKFVNLYLKFHYGLFLKVQLTNRKYWFR